MKRDYFHFTEDDRKIQTCWVTCPSHACPVWDSNSSLLAQSPGPATLKAPALHNSRDITFSTHLPPFSFPCRHFFMAPLPSGYSIVAYQCVYYILPDFHLSGVWSILSYLSVFHHSQSAFGIEAGMLQLQSVSCEAIFLVPKC